MSERLAAALAELVDALHEEMRTGPGNGHGMPDRLLSVGEAATALGIGRSLTYDLLASGRLRSVKVGRRRLVPSGALAEYTAADPPEGHQLIAARAHRGSAYTDPPEAA